MKNNLGKMSLKSISKTEVESEEGESESFTATFENKDNGLKASVRQPKEFNLKVGQDYEIIISDPQTKLEG